MNTNTNPRACRFCGQVSKPQKREDGPMAYFTNSAGVRSWRRSTAVEYIPAIDMNAAHEFTCKEKS